MRTSSSRATLGAQVSAWSITALAQFISRANQCKKWGPKFFKPAVKAVAKARPDLAEIADATPYSMRRGGISARLRAEDAQTVKQECGTSLRMLDKHYAFEIDDLRRFGPVPLNDVWSAAREQSWAVNEPPALALVA
jgi:hypothetical protein